MKHAGVLRPSLAPKPGITLCCSPLCRSQAKDVRCAAAGEGNWKGSLLLSGFCCYLKQPLFFREQITYFIHFLCRKERFWSTNGDVSKQRCFPTASFGNSDFFFLHFCSNKPNCLQFICRKTLSWFPQFCLNGWGRGGGTVSPPWGSPHTHEGACSCARRAAPTPPFWW